MMQDLDRIDAEVRALLDAMRNAHLQMVLGNPARALEYIAEAEAANATFQMLCARNPRVKTAVADILTEVLADRATSLRALVQDALVSPKTTEEVVAFVARPLPPKKQDR